MILQNLNWSKLLEKRGFHLQRETGEKKLLSQLDESLNDFFFGGKFKVGEAEDKTV